MFLIRWQMINAKLGIRPFGRDYIDMSEKQLKPCVVLVADRTLSASYKILFEGIFATMQTTQVPEIAMSKFVAPKMPTDSAGRAVAVPLGLRRVESALLEYTDLTGDDVVCTTPEGLKKVLGPWVKVVGVSSSDPLGKGMSNTTTTSFWDGDLYTKYWTRKMLQEISDAKDKYGFKVVGGGAGSWQWNRYEDETAKKCIDVVFEGYFENLGPQLFADLIEGNETESYICESRTCRDSIRPLAGASMLGIIELSRGCGRGCSFCTMAAKKMEHLPVETIISDLKTNVAAGIRSVVSGSEDFFRYGAAGLKPEFDKLYGLLTEMQKIRQLRFMQIDHGNVTSVMQMTDEELREIRRLLTWSEKSDYLWVNMGVESANGQLVAANCPGKVAPCRPEDWDEVVRQSVDRLTANGFFPVISLVLGLPGETGADVEQTLRLVKFLEKRNAVVFPIFYEPLLAEEIARGVKFTRAKMRAEHLELYRTCYEINFKKVPPLFWDNQRAGGVPWIKRALMRTLGYTEIYSWRKKFRQTAEEIRKRAMAVKD